MRRQGVRVASLAALALTMAGCGLLPMSHPAAKASQAASPLAGAQWTPCRDVATAELNEATFPQKIPLPSTESYDCATVQVPQDWSHPDSGKTFGISVIRARSSAEHNRIGSLLVDPGGPGGSGVQLAVELSIGAPSEIRQRFDLVGFDPRGAGRSDPIDCFTDAQLDASFAADPDPVSQADFDATVALDRAMANQCAAKYGDTLRYFSTEQAARDMDAIRTAVGDPKLTYLGYSYGTLLGAVYAQLFPTHIRALVLDGAVDPTQDAVASSQSQAAGFEHAFDDFTTWCQQGGCPLAPDPRARVQAALAAARVSPVQGPDGRQATAGWIFTGVVSALYSKSEWSTLASAIQALDNGDATAILGLADEYAQRSPDGTYSPMFATFTTVSCEDDKGGETVAQARALQSQWRTQYPLFGADLAIGLATCAVWPVQRDPYPTGQAVGAPPMVVVGTTNDPATPYAQAVKLTAMLGNTTLVTWQGEGHTAYPQTSCIVGAVDRYLINLTVPVAGLVCPATG
jgi:pimeloyl-ACP methyl ester carboxylesterase